VIGSLLASYWLVISGGVLLGLGLAWLAMALHLARRHPEPHWDWDAIDTEEVRFPEDFLWGVATAAHQVEGGCDNNNWSAWEQARNARGEPRIARGQVAGAACEHWKRYEQDIQLMKRLGVRSYRFSLEWSKIEPRQGFFDPAAIQHYHDVFDALQREGLEPMVTLLHFTWPSWFEELGAFEREENIAIFQRFCERVFGEYGHRARLWCTINEVEVVSLIGYLLGMFPPGKRDLRATAQVMRNLVLAHGRVYHALKAMPGGQRARIGLVKNIFQFDPSRRWNLPDWIAARLVERAHNGCILDYLETGVFRFRVPGIVWLITHDPEVKGAGDFIGLNYYSHFNARVRLHPWQPVCNWPRPEDQMSDMHYPLYPEGFHRALHCIAQQRMPIYVTENGVADGDDRLRARFIRRYIYAMHRAMQQGVDVRGYYYWSLMDNFEWAEGYDMRFGLYEVDFDTQERRLRAGAQPFLDVVRRNSSGS